MTEQNVNAGEVSSQNQGQPVQAPATSASNAPVNAPEPTPTAEKLYTDNDVNELVKSKYAKGIEKGRQETLAQLQAQQTTPPQASVSNVAPKPANNPTPLNPSEIQALVDKQIEQRVINNELQKVNQSFNQKILTGRQTYSDFNEVTAPLGIHAENEYAQVLRFLTNSVENTTAVTYYLGNNPGVVPTLMNLFNFNPHLAQVEMRKISAAVKQNEEALKQPRENPPLSHVKPSNTGIDDGQRTISDIARDPRYRV